MPTFKTHKVIGKFKSQNIIFDKTTFPTSFEPLELLLLFLHHLSNISKTHIIMHSGSIAKL
jgi:hypothetical protein